MSEIDVVAALRQAMADAGPDWSAQPSRLRRRLDDVLGADARAHRSQVHLIVVAAEEKVPVRLRRNGWSPAERDEVVAALADARGWTRQAATWSVVTWGAALGLTDDRPDPLAGARDATPAVPPASAVTSAPDTILPEHADPATVLPEGTNLPEGPDTILPEDAPATVLPEDPATVLPPEPSPAFAPPPPPPAPAVQDPLPPPRPMPVARAARRPRPDVVPTDQLPKKGTEKIVKRATTALGHEVDVAYLVHTRHPGFLLVSVLAALPLVFSPAPGLRLICAVAVFVCTTFYTSSSRALALRGDDVWLMETGWFSTKLKPPSVVATRSDIELSGGFGLSSVRLGDLRLWFFLNQRGVAEVLPTTEPVEGPVS